MVYFILYAKESILCLAGESFLPATASMIILMPTVLFIGLSNITGIQILTPLGRENHVVCSVTAGAILDFLLNLILIPKFGAGCGFNNYGRNAGADYSVYVFEKAVVGNGKTYSSLENSFCNSFCIYSWSDISE